ncbi:protein Shroom3 isoform X3 [Paramormyrops kingsleyae]|uniref:protein Shroom3 isoform X3 n=1 Tax=Paramormyrops kingsleyae TaxID=1676925 RepID=UPI000CD6635E|nr:protein Shroom3 isoform X3 [Paramormyrops kingsleyae]
MTPLETMKSHSYSSRSILHRGKLLYVEAVLQGGAPWGFTLKGGIEHGEKLIISKVEEGGKAGLLQHPLEPGDQVVTINHVELSGSRQEAISLVKGSYKTLRLIVSRQSGSTSRPHSWHSTKLGEGQQDPSMMQISQSSVAAPWHHSYHSSLSTTDLSSYDAGFLRKSPDQYSSRGSMESLDHGHPAYSSCHQLSSSKSSNSIDHLHNKRDSAYSSFSNSSSIPEYPPSGPSFSKERSYSMDSMLSQRGPEGVRQADMRYVRTVYDPQQGISEEHQVSSAKVLRNNEGRTHADVRGGMTGASANHALWGQTHGRNSCESLKGGPPPPLRSDSYAAIKNHERPNSWSSLEQTRSLRASQKGFWHQNSASFPLVKTFATDGQLHTVVEKSPESSPTTKPRQNFPQTSQTGHPMLPTGIYPVPQPEPHYAQVPSCCPNSGGMCPALAKESVCSSYRDQERELNTDQSKTEKECQSQASSTASQPTNAATKPKPPMHHDRRRPDDSDTKCSHYRPHFKTGVDGYGISQNQEDGYRHVSQNLNQERRDPYTRVKPREEKQRPSQGSEVCAQTREKEEIQANTWNHPLEITHLQNKPLSTVAQDEFNCTQEMYGRPRDISVPASHSSRGDTAHSQKNNSMRRVLPRQSSDSSLQKQKQQDHPLTKLENALIQVQNSAGSEAFVGQCSTRSEKDESDAVHLSVLEKVSRFEREQKRLYSHSDVLPNKRAEPRGSSSHSRTQSWSVERKDIVQLEDNKEPQQYPTRHRMCGNQEPPTRNPHNKPMVIQRSKSTFQLGGNNEKEFHWKEDLEEILGTIQDVSYNRTYRDSIKDAQSKVLRSTSFRRRDLSAKPVPNKHLSLERKVPKTSPKPCVASLHTPKERHVVTPEVQKSAPPPLPSRPAVGFPITRIGGRKRLTAEQKKRSYSEPENMHEVGLSRGEDSQKRTAQQFFIPETSVADRCKLFEMAATKSTGPSLSIAHSELKQIQQDALAEYMERKTGRRSSLQNRPTSAYMQAPCPDSTSVCASGFLFSQEQGFHFTTISDSQKGTNHMMYAIPSNLKRTVHPNVDSSEMAYLESCSNNPTSFHKDKDPLKQPFSDERELHKPGRVASSVPVQNQLHLQNQEETFERVAPPRNSGKSASAEDLLRCPEEERAVPQHYRSRSSPSMEKHYKDLTGADHAAFGVTSRHPLFLNPSDSRPVKDVDQKQTAVPLDGDKRSLLRVGLSPPSALAVHGEKPKPTERHRVLSAAGLAASVGLPCSFAPPPRTAKLNWQTDKSPCQATLDTFARNTFPFLGQDGKPSAESQAALAALTSSSDTSVPQEASEEEPSSKIPAVPNTPSAMGAAALQNLLAGVSCSTSSELESPPATQPQPLLSLCISESNLQASPPSLSFKDVVVDDDVFLEEHIWPSRRTPSIQDTDIKEGVPPPIPAYPPAGDGLGINTINRRSVDRDLAEYHPFLPAQAENTDSPSKAILRSPSVDGETRVAAERQNSIDEQEALQENPVLCRRERSAEEVRVEALAQMLLSKDKSLTPVLGTWAVKNTMDLMEDIFPTLTPPLRPEKTSAQMEDREKILCLTLNRKQEPDKDLQNKPRGMETDLDKEEENLKQKKTELVEALTVNIAALREEKAGLAEEQRKFSALEGHLEALIQECCKPSEQDKYHMFVGDLDKIVNLLLSLCSRLVRVENSLRGLEDEDAEDNVKEKESLQLKQRQLRAQHQDARELKENLDRRERVVFEILAGHFGRQQLCDYQRFVQMKPALLIRQRCLDDLIREAEEQLQSVTERLLSEGHVPIQEGGVTSAAVSSSARTPTVTSL